MYLNEGCSGVGWSFDASYLGDPRLGEMGREVPEVTERGPWEARRRWEQSRTTTAGGKGRAVGGAAAAALESPRRLQDLV